MAPFEKNVSSFRNYGLFLRIKRNELFRDYKKEQFIKTF
jgi:hypothetical protein